MPTLRSSALAAFAISLFAAGVTVAGDVDPVGPGELASPPALQPITAEGAYTPPPCVGLFTDVPCSGAGSQFATWIEQYSRDGITSGCAAGLYCPDSAVTRRQMAVFVERAMRGTDAWPPHTMLVFAVRGSDGSPDAAGSGAALLAAIAAIPTAGNDVPSASNPWLVKVGPGRYDIGTGSLVLPSFTALEGAGKEITVVTASGYASSSSGTIVMGNYGQMSRLTVYNSGGGSYEIAVFIPTPATQVGFEHVKLNASNQTNASGTAYALRADNNTSFSLVDCELTAHGAYTNYGIFAYSTGVESRLEGVKISAYGSNASGNSVGFYSSAASPVISSSRITVSGGTLQYGIFASGGGAAVDLRNSEIDVSGPGAGVFVGDVSATLLGDVISSGSGYGVQTSGSAVAANIGGSFVSGGGGWLNNASGNTVTVESSKLTGATVNAGTVHCFGNSTAAAFFASTCP
jgi:hypothetical protein